MEEVARLHTEARKKAGPNSRPSRSELADATQIDRQSKPPEYGYHSQLSAKQEGVKWVQVDLGVGVKLDRIVLRPCHDEFNNIGAGFGFPGAIQD